MTLEEYKTKFTEDDTVGWDAIDLALQSVYPDQEPDHYAPVIHYRLGGNDPIDGISVYRSSTQEPHLHFVTYGFSELYYDESLAGQEFSKWGFELTFRLKEFADDNGSVGWVTSLLQNLARYVFDSEKWFEEFHFIPANGPIRLNTETEITAIAFIVDPELGKINTPNGEIAFLQMVGITTAEYEKLQKHPKLSETEKLLNELKENNQMLITDLF